MSRKLVMHPKITSNFYTLQLQSRTVRESSKEGKIIKYCDLSQSNPYKKNSTLHGPGTVSPKCIQEY